MLFNAESMGNVGEPQRRGEYFLAGFRDRHHERSEHCLLGDRQDFLISCQRAIGRGMCKIQFEPCQIRVVSPNVGQRTRLVNNYELWRHDDHLEWVRSQFNDYAEAFGKAPPEWTLIGNEIELMDSYPRSAYTYLSDLGCCVFTWAGSGEFTERYKMPVEEVEEAEEAGMPSTAPESIDGESLYAFFDAHHEPEYTKPSIVFEVGVNGIDYELLARLPRFYFQIIGKSPFSSLIEEAKAAEEAEAEAERRGAFSLSEEQAKTRAALLALFGE